MFKYELHLHTSEGSLCGRASGTELIDFYIQHGYSGAVITDHFYHGNTRPDRELDWQSYVEEYAKGYEMAKAAAKGKDFDVFFGIEERLDQWDEYIVLGITPKFLVEHPELRTVRGKDFFTLMHEAGAFIIHAHPYRERGYMLTQTIVLRPNDVDAIEVRNCGNTPECDRRGYEYAKKLGLPMTGGSDRHSVTSDNALSGIELPFRCHTAEELISAIREGKAKVIDLEASAGATLSKPEFSVETY